MESNKSKDVMKELGIEQLNPNIAWFEGVFRLEQLYIDGSKQQKKNKLP